MKTSAVTVLVCGMVSLVGGVVALTVPYMGYPWLRHSVFLQIVGVCGIVVGVFISLYYLSNADRGNGKEKRNEKKRRHEKTFQPYPDFLGKENFAGPQQQHAPVQIFTLNEKEEKWGRGLPENSQPYSNSYPASKETDRPKGQKPKPNIFKARTSSIKRPRRADLRSVPKLDVDTSSILSSATSQHRKGDAPRSGRNDSKHGKSKSVSRIFFKRKALPVGQKKVQVKSFKQSMAPDTKITGLFQSLRKQKLSEQNSSSLFNNQICEIKGLENLAGPQYEHDEEEVPPFIDQNPQLFKNNNNYMEDPMIKSSHENILSNQIRDFAGQEKISIKQVDKAPVDGGEILGRLASEENSKLSQEVPSNPTEQRTEEAIKCKITKASYMFNWKKKGSKPKQKLKNTKKLKKGKLIGIVNPFETVQYEEQSKHPFPKIKMFYSGSANGTGKSDTFCHEDLASQNLSSSELPEINSTHNYEHTNNPESNEQLSDTLYNTFVYSVPIKLEVPEKNETNKNETLSRLALTAKEKPSISMEKMKNKFPAKQKTKTSFNFLHTKQEKNKTKLKTTKSLSQVRKAKHPYESSPDIKRSMKDYRAQQAKGTSKYQVDDIRSDDLEARTFNKNIDLINNNLKILSDSNRIIATSEPLKELERVTGGVNLDPGGRKLKRVELGDSTDSLFSARESLLSFGSTGSYNSAGSISNPLRSSMKKARKVAGCESGSVLSSASGRKSVRIALGGEQTAV